MSKVCGYCLCVDGHMWPCPHQEIERLRAENERLRAALKRNLQGYRNLIEFRRIGPDRYGALTREEIEQEITLIEAALAGEDSNG